MSLHPGEKRLLMAALGWGDAGLHRHLAACAQCRMRLQSLQHELNGLTPPDVPEPDSQFETRLWNQIAPRLDSPAAPARRFRAAWLAAPALALAALLALVLFLPSRRSAPATPAKLRPNPKILMAAVSGHLDRAQMLLLELDHAARPGQRHVNLAREQSWARQLADSNRIYQQAANASGQRTTEQLLSDLEPVLLQVAHSPDNVSARQWETLRNRIEASGILFKIRVADQSLTARLRAQAQVQTEDGTL